MKIEQALNKVAELGQQLILNSDPEVSHLGAALLALPITATEDCEDFRELVHMIFMFVKVKESQKEAIQKLLDPNEN
jgi:hypothetical protein